jgi:hypothetical protein
MKATKRILVLGTALVLAVFLWGCSKTSPTQFNQNDSQFVSPAENATFTTFSADEINESEAVYLRQILSLEQQIAQLQTQKGSAHGWVAIKSKELQQAWKNELAREMAEDNANAKAIDHWRITRLVRYQQSNVLSIPNVMRFSLASRSLIPAADAVISIDVQLLSNGMMQFAFAPHGLIFNPDAKISLYWYRLPLKGTANTISFNYYNPTSGQWEIVSQYNVSNNSAQTPIYSKDGAVANLVWISTNKNITFQIEHFSLYSFIRD